MRKYYYDKKRKYGFFVNIILYKCEYNNKIVTKD